MHRCVEFDVGSIANIYTNDSVFNNAIVEEFVSKLQIGLVCQSMSLL